MWKVGGSPLPCRGQEAPQSALEESVSDDDSIVNRVLYFFSRVGAWTNSPPPYCLRSCERIPSAHPLAYAYARGSVRIDPRELAAYRAASDRERTDFFHTFSVRPGPRTRSALTPFNCHDPQRVSRPRLNGLQPFGPPGRRAWGSVGHTACASRCVRWIAENIVPAGPQGSRSIALLMTFFATSIPASASTVALTWYLPLYAERVRRILSQ